MLEIGVGWILVCLIEFRNYFFLPIFLLQTLEERDRRHLQHKDQLYREQRFMRRKLEQLSQQQKQFDLQPSKRRVNSLSECSASTITSSASSVSESGLADFYGTFHFNNNNTIRKFHLSIAS